MFAPANTLQKKLFISSSYARPSGPKGPVFIIDQLPEEDTTDYTSEHPGFGLRDGGRIQIPGWVRLNSELHWTDNTDALYKKGQSRLHLLRRLRSFGVQRITLSIL